MTFFVKRDVLSVDIWFLELVCWVDELALINAISIKESLQNPAAVRGS